MTRNDLERAMDNICPSNSILKNNNVMLASRLGIVAEYAFLYGANEKDAKLVRKQLKTLNNEGILKFDNKSKEKENERK